VQAAREAARRMQCANHVKQLSLSVHTFHDAHNIFPSLNRSPMGKSVFASGHPDHYAIETYGRSFTSNGPSGDEFDSYGVCQASWAMFVCPFMEQTALYEHYIQLLRDSKADNDDQMDWFASPNNHQNDVGNAQIATYVCPSDAVGKHNGARGTTGRNSYVGCHGDLGYAGSTTFFRGAIGSGMVTIGMGALSDGTSNTLLFSEIIIGTPGSQRVKGGVAHPEEGGCNDWMAPMACLNTRGANGQFKPDIYGFLKPADPWTLEGFAVDQLRHGSGRQWMKGDGITGYFHAALPPNSPTCTSVWINYGALVSAGSFHTGGVNAGMSDGSGKFLSETIDTGRIDRGANDVNNWNYRPPYSGRSPYGVWGALGSRNGGESVTLP
jgi:hypothetical protein